MLWSAPSSKNVISLLKRLTRLDLHISQFTFRFRPLLVLHSQKYCIAVSAPRNDKGAKVEEIIGNVYDIGRVLRVPRQRKWEGGGKEVKVEVVWGGRASLTEGIDSGKLPREKGGIR
jgi:hypothetical protein